MSKKPPTKFENLNKQVASYNGLIAKWQSCGYRGKPPNDLLETIVNMYDEIEKFLIKPERVQ